MDTYQLLTEFNALQTTEENRAALLAWGIDIDTFMGVTMWVVVEQGSVLPVAIVDDTTFQDRYAKVTPPDPEP
jgi:hypothetical protein